MSGCNRVNAILRTLIRLGLVIPLLILPFPAHSNNFASPQPTAAYSLLATIKTLAPIATRPDFDTDVLVPLRLQQATARAKADALAAQRVAEAALAYEAARLAAIPVLRPQTAPMSGGDSKAFIYNHESGNNPGSINASSGACGLGQALPCSKMPCSLSDYTCQDNFFTNYMLSRYKTWAAAENFWLQNHWW